MGSDMFFRCATAVIIHRVGDDSKPDHFNDVRLSIRCSRFFIKHIEC